MLCWWEVAKIQSWAHLMTNGQPLCRDLAEWWLQGQDNMGFHTLWIFSLVRPLLRGYFRQCRGGGKWQKSKLEPYYRSKKTEQKMKYICFDFCNDLNQQWHRDVTFQCYTCHPCYDDSKENNIIPTVIQHTHHSHLYTHNRRDISVVPLKHHTLLKQKQIKCLNAFYPIKLIQLTKS